MKRALRSMVVALSVAGILVSVPAVAGEVDILVKKLVEKGILTEAEAKEIITETKEEVRKEVAQGTYSSLPSWLQTMKLNGDFRMRYQWEDKQGTTPVVAQDQHRARVRLRLGVEAKVNDKLKVLAGLATGGTDPRSTNETLDNTFEHPDIRLDYAMAEWYATPWLSLKMGKLKSVNKQLMVPTDFLWDTDVNPEGGSLQLAKDIPAITGLNLFFNTGAWIIDEYTENTDDPFMYYVQPGFSYKFLEDNLTLKMACANYFFDNIQGRVLDNSAATNSLVGTPAGLRYNYNTVSPSAELGIKDPLLVSGIAGLDYVGIFGEGIHNPDPSDDNNGWATGIRFGAEKISDWGQWQAAYLYRRLERDAWLDTFPDADTQGGRTDVKGHEAILEIGLGKNTSLGIDWYEIERLKLDNRRNVFQVDWNMKF